MFENCLMPKPSFANSWSFFAAIFLFTSAPVVATAQSFDIKALYESAPLKVGDLLPEEVQNGAKGVHCAGDVRLRPVPKVYDKEQHVQGFGCEPLDSKSPVKEITSLVYKATGARVSTVAFKLRDTYFKNPQQVMEQIKLQFTEPVYDGSDFDEEKPGSRFFASVKIDDNHFADLTLMPTKKGLELTNFNVRACSGDWIKPETMFSDWAGNCSVVLGKAEKWAESPAYKKQGPPGPLTAEEIEEQLNPTALYAMAPLKIGQAVPEEAKVNTAPGFCPPKWQPTMKYFGGMNNPNPPSETTHVGCNSKNDQSVLMGMDTWANIKQQKIVSIDFLVRKKMLTAKSLKELDQRLGKTVLINSSHPDVARPVDGKGYLYLNKIEPDILVVYDVSSGKSSAAVTEIRLYDCATLVGWTQLYPACKKLGLVKIDK